MGTGWDFATLAKPVSMTQVWQVSGPFQWVWSSHTASHGTSITDHTMPAAAKATKMETTRWRAEQDGGPNRGWASKVRPKISFLFYTTDYTTEPQHAMRRAMPACRVLPISMRWGGMPLLVIAILTWRGGAYPSWLCCCYRYNEEEYTPLHHVILSISTWWGGYAFPVVSSFPFRHDEEGVHPRRIVLAISTWQGGYALPVMLPFPFQHGQKGCTPLQAGRVIAILMQQERVRPSSLPFSCSFNVVRRVLPSLFLYIIILVYNYI